LSNVVNVIQGNLKVNDIFLSVQSVNAIYNLTGNVPLPLYGFKTSHKLQWSLQQNNKR